MSKENNNIYDIINEYNEEIAEFESKIDNLEKEIKQMKKEGKPRAEILKKQLEVGKLQLDVIGDKEVILRKAFGEIQKKAKDKAIDDKKYIENLHLKDCYYNDLQVQRESLEQDNIDIQLKILGEDYAKNGNTEEYAKSRKSLEQDKNMHQVQYDSWQKNLTKSMESYSKMTGKDSANIDFNIPYESYLYESEPDKVQNYWDIFQLNDDIYRECKNNNVEFDVNKENCINKTKEIFTNNLSGEDKELAEVYSEIYSNYIMGEVLPETCPFRELLYKKEIETNESINHVPIEIKKIGENKYTVIYEMGDDNERCGISFTRNPETHEFELSDKLVDNKTLSRQEGIFHSVTFEQMNEQVVRHNIEQSMGNENITELLEIKDEKMLEYLEEQNGIKGIDQESRFRAYAISKQDKDGNIHYEFVAHSNSHDYKKLSGIEEIENKQNRITTDKYTMPNSNLGLTHNVDAQFLDANGNSYYIYHPLERDTMDIAYSEKGKENDTKESIEVGNTGLNTALHKTRIKELLMSGYSNMSIGIEKVKEVLHKLKEPKEKQNEMEEER